MGDTKVPVLTLIRRYVRRYEGTFEGTFVFWISGSYVDTPEIIIIIPYGRINSRMTSYLKIFATGRTNLKIFPSGMSTAA